MTTSITERPTVAPAGRPARRAPRGLRARTRRLLIAAVFLAPALIILGALVAYPIVYTAVRSAFAADGAQFVGWDNYVRMFQNDSTFTAIRNNLMWVIVAPVACTSLGLIFAVLLDKIRWSTAFKLIIFMPMAISMLAAGVIFRGMFQENPNLGPVNAIIVGVQNAVSDTAGYPGAEARDETQLVESDGALTQAAPVTAGSTVELPLVGIRAADIPADAAQAEPPASADADQISGVIWLDVLAGGGGEAGTLDEGERGLPGVVVNVVAADGAVLATATSDTDGRFVIDGLDPGQQYSVALPATNFSAGPIGVSWLSSSFINIVVMLSYIWIWAGFAMVMIAAGLSAIDRSLLEAARMDGASEWKVFSKITAPLLSPVLAVVLVTLVINVMKVFDLVYVIPPGASRPAANVIAVEMWTVSFGGGNDQGLGSALAILLLLLVLPSMFVNIKRIREERSR